MERPTSSQVFSATFPRHQIDRAGFSRTPITRQLLQNV